MRGIGRWKRPCGATRAGTQAPPLPISIIFFYAIPHKQNNHSRVINPNETNRPTRNLPNEIDRPPAIHPNKTVGAVPVCPPERPRSGVSIPRTCALCVEILTMDAPLQGDMGGHTGTAPTTLRNIFPRNPSKQHQPPTHNPPKRNT